MSSRAARQAMQAPAGDIHILRAFRHIQTCQLALQLGRMVRLNAGLAAGLEKPLQPFVLEALDHGLSV